jgi:hypothetical protein
VACKRPFFQPLRLIRDFLVSKVCFHIQLVPLRRGRLHRDLGLGVGHGVKIVHFISLNYAALSLTTTEATKLIPQLSLKLSDKVNDCKPLVSGKLKTDLRWGSAR